MDWFLLEHSVQRQLYCVEDITEETDTWKHLRFAKRIKCNLFNTDSLSKEINDDPMYIKGPMSPNVLLSKNLESPKLDEWEFPASQVVIEKRLGEGCFGEVFQGVIKGPISNPKVQASLKNIICPVVAIKLLKCKTVLYCTKVLETFINSYCQWK